MLLELQPPGGSGQQLLGTNGGFGAPGSFQAKGSGVGDEKKGLLGQVKGNQGDRHSEG